ncbi:MAG TPA: hypothetical protein VMU75_07235 [Acidimicrobiales bacterium]|nr:hypothetical protein [Acidimicrobiales bacterium]
MTPAELSRSALEAPDRLGGPPTPEREAPDGPRRPPFRRRTTALALAAVAVVVAVAVVTDLPRPATLASERADARSTILTIASDVSACAVAVTEALTIYRYERAGTLTRGDRSQAPGILADDENGCSYTNQSIVDLASMNISGAGVGRTLGVVASDALSWADPDGLTAIEAVSTLLDHPTDTKAQRNLVIAEGHLRSDRAAANGALARAAKAITTVLPPLSLPSVSP